LVFVDFNTGGRYNPGTDSWVNTGTNNAPLGRRYHTAVWTGSEMIVWGGDGQEVLALDTGGKYGPAIDTWTATSTTDAPDGRAVHTAVWDWQRDDRLGWRRREFPPFEYWRKI